MRAVILSVLQWESSLSLSPPSLPGTLEKQKVRGCVQVASAVTLTLNQEQRALVGVDHQLVFVAETGE